MYLKNKTTKLYYLIIFLLINLFIYYILNTILFELKYYNTWIFYLMWIFLELILIVFTIICYFYYILILFIIKNFFNNWEKQKSKSLNIIDVVDHIYIDLSTNDVDLSELHPFSDYYFEWQDLSLNLNCDLKWIKWGTLFFKTIKTTLNDKYYIENYLNFEANFKFNNTIQSLNLLNLLEKKENVIELHINELFAYDIQNIYIIDEKFNIDDLIKKFNNINNDTNSLRFYKENETITFKLKLNIIEYLVLSSKKLYPIFKKKYN